MLELPAVESSRYEIASQESAADRHGTCVVESASSLPNDVGLKRRGVRRKCFVAALAALVGIGMLGLVIGYENGSSARADAPDASGKSATEVAAGVGGQRAETVDRCLMRYKLAAELLASENARLAFLEAECTAAAKVSVRRLFRAYLPGNVRYYIWEFSIQDPRDGADAIAESSFRGDVFIPHRHAVLKKHADKFAADYVRPGSVLPKVIAEETERLDCAKEQRRVKQLVALIKTERDDAEAALRKVLSRASDESRPTELSGHRADPANVEQRSLTQVERRTRYEQAVERRRLERGKLEAMTVDFKDELKKAAKRVYYQGLPMELLNNEIAEEIDEDGRIQYKEENVGPDEKQFLTKLQPFAVQFNKQLSDPKSAIVGRIAAIVDDSTKALKKQEKIVERAELDCDAAEAELKK